MHVCKCFINSQATCKYCLDSYVRVVVFHIGHVLMEFEKNLNFIQPHPLPPLHWNPEVVITPGSRNKLKQGLLLPWTLFWKEKQFHLPCLMCSKSELGRLTGKGANRFSWVKRWKQVTFRGQKWSNASHVLTCTRSSEGAVVFTTSPPASQNIFRLWHPWAALWSGREDTGTLWVRHFPPLSKGY